MNSKNINNKVLFITTLHYNITNNIIAGIATMSTETYSPGPY